MNKKWLVTLMMFAAMIFAIAGCGKKAESAVVGTWTVTSIEINGETLDWKEFQGMLNGGDKTAEENNADLEMTIDKDGKFSTKFGEETNEGTWTEKDGVYTLDEDGDQQKATIKSGKLVFEDFAGAGTLTMEKK